MADVDGGVDRVAGHRGMIEPIADIHENDHRRAKALGPGAPSKRGCEQHRHRGNIEGPGPTHGREVGLARREGQSSGCDVVPSALGLEKRRVIVMIGAAGYPGFRFDQRVMRSEDVVCRTDV